MDPSLEQLRFYVFTRRQLGDAPPKIYADLMAVYGEECVTYRTVCRWIQHFREGKIDLKDEHRKGRPTVARNEQTVLLVKKVVEDDPHISIREISETYALSYGTVERILRDDLKLKKVAARWIPHLLTEAEKKRRVDCSKQLLKMFGPDGPKRLCDVVTGDETWMSFYGIPNKRSNKMWVGPEDERPVVLRPGFQSRKRLFSIFFNYQGPVVVDILPQKETITAKYYAKTVLPQVMQSICEQRPNVGTQKTLLLHDNASAHKAKVTVTYLEEQGVQVLPHPPYSPDLAPCDFWLFPLMKQNLSGRKFTRIQDLGKAVKSQLHTIPESEYRNAFDSWLRRLTLCVQRGGEYFEGM